ncbi:MAG: type II toxin-antitoxin system VapC family toxin [Haliscomenobacter sp.]|uniref:type II toxin-antitoxin system VapC family toxin n=1 Tax=Haliscomenobacter sp. TaxID=2717303 RepID=UPI0029A368AB|nr:type II toxin-antitoxin system VapC family toxin [Haliscomenobacter sp.]MDX2071767.1 type II toxin-antitoxin system VapC family toxin [Haliscomenobacter sp.]
MLQKKQLDPGGFIQPEDQLFISDISFMETLGYPFSDENEKRETEALLGILFRFSIEESIVQKVVEIKQQRRIKLPDAIIAATAIVHNCAIVTRNVSDFQNLAGVVVINPM